MRILCPNYSPIEDNGLLWGLRKLGHDVRTCNLRLAPPEVRAEVWHHAWAEYGPDLVLNYGYWLDRFAVSDLDPPPGYRRVPFVYWACDDPVFLHISSLPMLERADLVLTVAEECIPVYVQRDRRAGFLQHGCNPELMRRVGPADRHQCVLAANNYVDSTLMPYRLHSVRTILFPLLDAGYDIRVYGKWWLNCRELPAIPAGCYGGDLPYQQLPVVYAGADIVLGLQCHNLSRTQTSCRLFEVLGCGALYLGPDTKGTRTYFEPGKHLLLSGSATETLALARYYLDHPADRQRIAAAGQMEVYRKHTSLHRAREFISHVERL